MDVSQLSKITFAGYPGTPILLGTGELVPGVVVTSPALAISGNANHGSSCIGTPTAPITYTITNTGGAASGVTVISNNTQFVVSGAPASIAGGGGTANYTVTFTPGGSGAQNATITVASTTSGSNSPTSGLTGTGNSIPTTVVGLSNQTVCGDGSVTFTVTDPGAGYTVEWSTDGSTNNDGTGLTKTKGVTVGSPITEYARISNTTTSCKSAWSSGYTGTANELPTVSSASVSPTSVCGSGQVTFSATASSGSIKWYDAITGGNEISVLNPTISSTTTYYAEATSPQGCTSTTRTAVTAIVNTLPTAYDVTGGGLYCSGGAGVAVGLFGSQNGVNYQLYRDASSVGSPIPGTGSAISFGSQTSEGTYTVKATNATTFCVQDMTGSASITIGDTTPPLITKCLIGGTVTCVKDIPPAITTIQEFISATGPVTDNCTATNSLTVSYNDVITQVPACKVSRVYTITDAYGNAATCTQVFSINDGTRPSITCNANLVRPPNINCGATLDIPAPTTVSDTSCSLVYIDPAYRFQLGDNPSSAWITGTGSITATTFPEGTTTIEWTITDLCGNISLPCYQTVKVGFDLTSISYDNGSSATDAGSGVQPTQTSTHEYFVDNKTPEVGYSYDWELYESNGTTTVTSSSYTITEVNNNPTHINISFTTIPTGNYILSVIKTKNETTCKKQKTLPVTIQANTFDTELKLFGNNCQSGETNTPSTILWEVDFVGNGVAPYSFGYAVTLDGTPICSGTVLNITLPGTNPTHSSGCDTSSMPYMRVVKTATDSYKVRLEYTLSSITAHNFQVSIQISNATDRFTVTQIETHNNSETLQLWGVPNTSAITTD